MPELTNITVDIAIRITDAASAHDAFNDHELVLVGALVLAGAQACPHLVEALHDRYIIRDVLEQKRHRNGDFISPYQTLPSAG